MKSKKLYVSLAVLTLILTAGVASVSAYQGDYSQKGPNTDPERCDAIQDALDNEDFDAWQKLMTERRGRVLELINEDNFSKFVEARRLGQSGDIEGADVLRAELGLRGSKGERMNAGFRRGGGEGRGQGNGTKGSNNGGNFLDADGNGKCDNLSN
jgi:hypothetical protein